MVCVYAQLKMPMKKKNGLLRWKMPFLDKTLIMCVVWHCHNYHVYLRFLMFVINLFVQQTVSKALWSSALYMKLCSTSWYFTWFFDIFAEYFCQVLAIDISYQFCDIVLHTFCMSFYVDQHWKNRCLTSTSSFEARLAEADAYLKLLIDQAKVCIKPSIQNFAFAD